MNEPQVWTLIGVFATALFAVITIVTQILWRSINSRFDSLQVEMQTGFASVRAETAVQFDAVNAQFASVRAETAAKLHAVETKIDHLDRDIQAISRRVFPE